MDNSQQPFNLNELADLIAANRWQEHDIKNVQANAQEQARQWEAWKGQNRQAVTSDIHYSIRFTGIDGEVYHQDLDDLEDMLKSIINVVVAKYESELDYLAGRLTTVEGLVYQGITPHRTTRRGSRFRPGWVYRLVNWTMKQS